MKTEIYVVTHGDKFGGANPGMTQKGYDEVKNLRFLIPGKPSLVVCGTGRRHIDVAKVLGLIIDRYTCLAGDSDSLEIINNEKVIVLADGKRLEPKLYTSLEDNAPGTKAMVASLPHNSIICGGRPTMIMLGFSKIAKSASVYKVTCEEGQIKEAIPITEYKVTCEEGQIKEAIPITE